MGEAAAVTGLPPPQITLPPSVIVTAAAADGGHKGDGRHGRDGETELLY